MEQGLNIEKRQYSVGMDTMVITGFTDDALKELKRMPNAEAADTLLATLDTLNGGIGTQWKRGYGVYGVWFDNEAAYVNIGTSCD